MTPAAAISLLQSAPDDPDYESYWSAGQLLGATDRQRRHRGGGRPGPRSRTAHLRRPGPPAGHLHGPGGGWGRAPPGPVRPRRQPGGRGRWTADERTARERSPARRPGAGEHQRPQRAAGRGGLVQRQRTGQLLRGQRALGAARRRRHRGPGRAPRRPTAGRTTSTRGRPARSTCPTSPPASYTFVVMTDDPSGGARAAGRRSTRGPSSSSRSHQPHPSHRRMAPMTARTRLAALLALLPVSLVALVGCGDDDEPQAHDPNEPAPSSPASPPRSRTPSVELRSRSDVRPGRRSPCRCTSSGPRRRARGCSASSAGRGRQPADEALALLTAGDALDPDYCTLLPEAVSGWTASGTDEIVISLPDAAWARTPGRHERPRRRSSRSNRSSTPSRASCRSGSRCTSSSTASSLAVLGLDATCGLQGRTPEQRARPRERHPARAGLAARRQVRRERRGELLRGHRPVGDPRRVRREGAGGLRDRRGLGRPPLPVGVRGRRQRPGARHLHLRGDDRRPVGRRGRRARPRTPRPSR